MLKKHQIREKVEQGGIGARIVLEVLGKPKEHVDETIKLLLGRLKEEETISVNQVKLADTIEIEGGMFSNFAEIELVADNLSGLVGLCFYYMPASIEITEPEELRLSASSMTNFYNDLLAKLHNVDMVAKNLRAENEVHKTTMGKLLRSSIVALVKQKKTAKEIADLLIIPADQCENILHHLQEEGLVKKVGKYFSR